MSQLNNLGKCLLLSLVLGYAVSCGFNTFYYTTRGKFELLKAKAILIAIFLSGLVLNFVLYAKDVLESETSNAKINEPAYVLSGLITLLTATATAIFTYHTLVNLDGFTFQTGVLWFIVISSFVATCALFFKDTAKKINGLINKKTSNADKKSNSTAKFLCKLSLLVIFIIGTLGFVKTMYAALAHNVDISLAWLLTAGIIISELCFLWSSADGFVENAIKFKEIVFAGKRKAQLKYIVFCIFMPIAITLALVNAFANGLLDADTFGADWSTLFIVAGTILSFCVMSSSMFNLLAPKTVFQDALNKAPAPNDSDPIPAQIDADMETQKPKSILMCMLSVASGISVPIMVQFKVPKPAVYAPIMLLLALFFALYYNYSVEMPTVKIKGSTSAGSSGDVKDIFGRAFFQSLENKVSQVSNLFAKK